MGHHVVEVVREARAAPESVWRWLADASSWREWTRLTDTRLVHDGSPEPDGVGAIRRFARLGGSSLEEVVAFDPPRHLGYVLVRGLPIRNYRSDVTLEPDGDVTRIRWHSEFDAKYPGTGALTARFIRSVLTDFATRLARQATAP